MFYSEFIVEQVFNHLFLYFFVCVQASMGWKQTKIDDSRQKVSSALSAMLASTASIITLTGGDPTETNYTAVGAAVTTM